MSAESEIKCIDIAPLVAADVAAPTPALDVQIAAALHHDGALLATGLPGARDLERRMDRLLAFFGLPEAMKAPLAIRKDRAESTNLYRGYYPLPRGSHWSYNEIFDIGPEPPLRVPDLPGADALREANVWPAEAVQPGWRRAMLEFCGQCRAISLAVVVAAARGLGRAPEELLAPCRGRNATLRLLRYAPIPPDFVLRGADGKAAAPEADGRRVLAREHIDTGLLSILWQDREGGLQMQGRDGHWRAVPARPDALSLHCGDLLAGLSGGALKATPHRVLGSGTERFSVGFFLEPDFTTEVLPPDASSPKTYAAHLIDEFPTRFLPPPPADDDTARQAHPT